jgi:hypothetical protein
LNDNIANVSLNKTGAATALAGLALTLAMAWPVVVSPGIRIFGHEIDGRHHDPYTVMWQFEHGPPPPPYRQPLVDDVGGLLAGALHPVAAFNAVVLVTFPLSVLAAFALARYLRLSNGGAAVAALAFAFAPPHLAQAAYHPHIAQTQWIPLYFLALWASVDRASPLRLALLLLAGAALTLSNIYAALIAAVITPVAIAAAWAARRDPARARHAALTFGVLVAAALAVLATARAALPALFADTAPTAFQQADLARYGAQWFSYFLPPVDHALWGSRAAQIWAGRGMTGAVLEQQISISLALLALAAVALWHWMRSRRTAPAEIPTALGSVPMLAIVALAAAFCSLAPAPGPTSASWLVPATWLYQVAPMFRAYARFAFVTHLMVALLAGIGFACLWRGARVPPSAARRALAAALLAAVALEYAPLPARARDVLPTAGHRWLASRAPGARVLDCVEPGQADALVPWLMKHDVSTLSARMPSCVEPNIAQQAATLGYTYMILRRTPGTRAPMPPTPGLALVHTADDADVYNVAADAAPVLVAGIEGFSPTERDASGPWRWMGQQGTWIVENVRRVPVAVTLELELSAYGAPRHLAVSLDGAELQRIAVTTPLLRHRLGPFTLGAGTHRLRFTALEPGSAAPGADPRQLTVMFRDWRWRVE